MFFINDEEINSATDLGGCQVCKVFAEVCHTGLTEQGGYLLRPTLVPWQPGDLPSSTHRNYPSDLPRWRRSGCCR